MAERAPGAGLGSVIIIIIIYNNMIMMMPVFILFCVVVLLCGRSANEKDASSF